MNLNDLYHLLYGFDQFFASRPQSIHPHDSPIFKVHVIPFDLGTDIRNSDPDEAFFHVEFYPPDRAELWNSKAWNESLTKRLRLAGQVTTYYRTPDEQLRADLECNLIKYFKAISLPFRHARALTELLTSGPENPTVLQLAALPPELIHQLQNYRNHVSGNSESETT